MLTVPRLGAFLRQMTCYESVRIIDMVNLKHEPTASQLRQVIVEGSRGSVPVSHKRWD